jgi:dolichol-phosphate mannosyltransferase
MTPQHTLTVIVPAYCEAGNIIGTLENVFGALGSLPLTYEVLVIDDGSTDGTGALVTANAGRFPGVRLLTNDRNRGLGWTYRRGVEAAAHDYIVMVHGDNAWGAATLRDLFSHVGDADVIVGYTRDMWASRPWARTAISKTFTSLVNVISGRRLRYYNGLQVHRAGVLKALTIQSSGYGFQAEVLVKALRRTHTFIEVAMDLMERERGESKAFRMKNVVDVARTLTLLCRPEPRAGLSREERQTPCT